MSKKMQNEVRMVEAKIGDKTRVIKIDPQEDQAAVFRSWPAARNGSRPLRQMSRADAERAIAASHLQEEGGV